MSQHAGLPRASSRVIYVEEVDAWHHIEKSSVKLVLTRVNTFMTKRTERGISPIHAGGVS